MFHLFRVIVIVKFFGNQDLRVYLYVHTHIYNTYLCIYRRRENEWNCVDVRTEELRILFSFFPVNAKIISPAKSRDFASDSLHPSLFLFTHICIPILCIRERRTERNMLQKMEYSFFQSQNSKFLQKVAIFRFYKYSIFFL